MTIKEAQEKVYKHLVEIGYINIEKTPIEAFVHLIEEIGEVARNLLHLQGKRKQLKYTTEPNNIEDEIADILWQLLKLSSYLKIDLETAFNKKYQKNLAKKLRERT